jgi:hypothetical protein
MERVCFLTLEVGIQLLSFQCISKAQLRIAPSSFACSALRRLVQIGFAKRSHLPVARRHAAPRRVSLYRVRLRHL